MQINLPPELEPFIEQEFATGRYATREEVVVQAVRMLCEERQEAVAGIRGGLADVDAGRVEPLESAFAEIRASRRTGQPDNLF